MLDRVAQHTLTALLIASLTMLLPNSQAWAQAVGEPLLEVPVHELPEGMTYEDYVAANLRITTGLTRALIPGGVHDYAGDTSTSRWLKITASLGLVAIIAGASQTVENTEPESDYELLTLPSGLQYEKIPVGLTEGPDGSANNTEYALKPVESHVVKPGGALLAAVGVGMIFGSYIYDAIEGIGAIEDARNRARFKYGKLKQAAQAKKVTLQPIVDPINGGAGVTLGMQF